MIRELVLDFPSMFIGLSDWFRLLDNTKYFDEVGDHAGEMETSIMQYLFPDLVLNLKEAGLGIEKQSSIAALNNKEVWTPRRWDKISEDTGIGNPMRATPEKGKSFIEDVTDNISEAISKLASTKLEDFYKE